MTNRSMLANISAEWLESLYNDWKREAASVPSEWQAFFTGYEFADSGTGSGPTSGTAENELKQSGVQSLIYRYRTIGHLLACTDPLSPCQLHHPLLELSCFGLEPADLDVSFACRRFMKQEATLREIVATMRDTYCHEIGVEFMHIQDPAERQWLIDAMEPCRNRREFSVEEKTYLLEKLSQAALFESFLHRRFIGQKRFSLEGGEILLPVLDRIVRLSPHSGVSDIVLGMSHRGRLNVMTHIFNKPYEALFAEFKDAASAAFPGDGDVKYHKGYSTTVTIDGSPVHLTLAANPSHLEAVNAVVEGKCRARQDSYGSDGRERVLPIQIHGDAAFAGQGSVMEVLNLSLLEGYATGGTIHIVLNNQIGFTTLPQDSRSTRYATDVAKMLACPIFHVQGESPESAVHVVQLAMEYRRAYRRDVVIELICYRRHGHNEGDEPAFTQPLMYRQITSRPSVNKIYAGTLVAEGALTTDMVSSLEKRVTAAMESAFDRQPEPDDPGFTGVWNAVSRDYSPLPVDTHVAVERLRALAQQLAVIPDGFVLHAKIRTLLQKRCDAVMNGEAIDWGTAEILAYATLLEDGYSVRLSGQDSRRGTFNHRHCAVLDSRDEQVYLPLQSITSAKASFDAWNSPLSEFGVLGFDYGYSLENPRCLTIWEAQFGDFANGAQVIIDQFIASGESKWSRASGLVMMLPHGYEGQGAEHSSARIERYLQMCANENMLVACPSTPAQIFHLLRRQMLQQFRKPLIIFTPKSLLRHPVCVSTVDQLATGNFQPLIFPCVGDVSITSLLLCSGKIYYELAEEAKRLGCHDVAIIRVEQLYPFNVEPVLEFVSRAAAGCRVTWVQEEPANMGAWQHISRVFEAAEFRLGCVARPTDACPAVGSHHIHAEQQSEIIRKAFDPAGGCSR
ncbi:MAG: 2-oxoglutarate dehydrogenase E1 component [Desulfuromonadales bacterium]